MEKNHRITAVRNFAALLVIVGHMYVLLGFRPVELLDYKWNHLGVRILFLLSGYLVLGSLQRASNLWSYLLKRISRLYPAYGVSLLLTVLVLRLVTNAPRWYWQSALDYLVHNIELRPVFHLAGVFESNPYPNAVNGSLWTMPVEMASYLLLIPVAKLFGRMKVKTPKAAALACGVLLAGLSVFDMYRELRHPEWSLIFWDTDWLQLISLFLWFMIGVTIALFVPHRCFSWRIALLLLLAFRTCEILQYPGAVIKMFCAPFIISYVVMCFVLLDREMQSAVWAPRDLCYGLYLYSYPVQQLLVYVFAVHLQLTIPIWAYISLSVLLTLPLALLSERFVERPSARWAAALTQKRRQGSGGKDIE